MTEIRALSIVIPLFDEEDSVVPLIRELGGVLDAVGRTAEIVVVDDGSTDRSFARLVAVQTEEPRLRIVRLMRNYGQTAAMAAGIAEARGDVLVTMDADRQNDPRDIPRLLGQAERTAQALSEMAQQGLRLDDHTVERLAEAQARENRASRIGIWIGAFALAAIAFALLF